MIISVYFSYTLDLTLVIYHFIANEQSYFYVASCTNSKILKLQAWYFNLSVNVMQPSGLLSIFLRCLRTTTFQDLKKSLVGGGGLESWPCESLKILVFLQFKDYATTLFMSTLGSIEWSWGDKKPDVTILPPVFQKSQKSKPKMCPLKCFIDSYMSHRLLMFWCQVRLFFENKFFCRSKSILVWKS